MKKKIRALLVEDNPDDVELVLHELERSGLDCEWERVEEREAFEEAIEKDGWDVVLADFTMPRFTAPAALEILKASGKDIPFIIVSGSVGEPIAVEAMKAGAHDFFPKGNIARLPHAIDREIREAGNRRRAAREKRELLDDLRQAVRARDEFLSIASHELKTPLTSMELQLERLRQLRQGNSLLPLADEQVARKLDLIERQTERLTVLVKNLLDVTRIASGRLDLRPETVDLGRLAEGVVGRMHDAIDRSGCEVTLRTAAGVVGRWDRLRLETLIANLLQNAIKYGAGRPVDLRVEDHGGSARLSVCDRGIGISAEDEARIFERFERAVPEQHYGGFGLGLWIVRQIAEAHGGSVHVDSRKDDGSTFTVNLPLDPPPGHDRGGASSHDLGPDRR